MIHRVIKMRILLRKRLAGLTFAALLLAKS